ncbi:hypothetical protein BGZ52_006971 [Haplosporangium bisporale]|nr:hypothetical protein BGZ52_006971 [Haplosporangium bisporale]
MYTPARHSQRIRIKIEKEAEVKVAYEAQLALQETQVKLRGTTPSRPATPARRGASSTLKASTATRAASAIRQKIKDTPLVSKNGSSTIKGKKRRAADEQESNQGPSTAIESVAALTPKRKKYSTNNTQQTSEVDIISKEGPYPAGEEEPVKPKRQNVRRKQAKETGDTVDKEAGPVKTKRASTRRNKVEANVGVKVEEKDAVVKQEEGEGIKSEKDDSQKKQRRARATPSQGKVKAADEHNTQETEATGTSEQGPVTVNPQDPCSVFPTELWHAVLDYLPLSVVANTSIISNAWLTAARAYNGWKIAAEKGGMGAPKTKYKSWMALVCSHSYFVCDRCMGFSNGKGRGSHIPLPVKMDDDDSIVWHMCWECRNRYYGLKPEPLRAPCNPEDKNTYEAGRRITKGRSMSGYALKEEDLAPLPREQRRNPHVRSAPPMLLFDEATIQDKAISVHAGWVGVLAAADNLLKKRRESFKARDDANRVSTRPKKEKPLKEPKPKAPKAPKPPVQQNNRYYGHYSYYHDYDGYDSYY